MEEVVKYNGNNGVALTDADIQTLVDANIIPKGTPKAQVSVFARTCSERNLSPFSKQIYLMKRETKQGTRYNTQTSIDGFRSIAERTNKYAGSDDYTFDEGIAEYQMIKDKRMKPTTATATVHKILPNQQIFPIKATVRWEEYYPGGNQGFMWDKMPFLMLGKCAEALALRKAFPEQLGSIYINEEMQQAETVIETPTEIHAETPVEVVEEQKEDLTAKYENLFKDKSSTEIKDVYNKLPLNEKGEKSVAYKIAKFYSDEYKKKQPHDEISILISKITSKSNEEQFSKIEGLIESTEETDKRKNYIDLLKAQLTKVGSKYEPNILPF